MTTIADSMTAIADRIIALESKLKAIARAYGPDADDVFGEIVVELVAKAKCKPSFASQKDAYLLRYARWMAKHAITRMATYCRFVDSVEVAEDVSEEDDGGSSVLAVCAQSAEDAAIERETRREIELKIEGLPRLQREAIVMLACGYTNKEIAARINTTKSSVSHTTRRARLALSD